MPAVILAIETSQHEGSIALRAPNGVVHVERLSSQRRHDDDLLPAIDRAFARTELMPEALRGGIVAVSIGPGGFTGLRIAVSTAKMFAEVLDTRIVAVPSALVAAEAVSDARPLICALSAKNETAWCARLARGKVESSWSIVGAPGVIEAAALDFAGVGVMLADKHLPHSFLARCAAAGVKVIAPAFGAAHCLAIGERLASAEQFTDPLALLPLYPRPPEAVTLWERRRRERP